MSNSQDQVSSINEEENLISIPEETKEIDLSVLKAKRAVDKVNLLAIAVGKQEAQIQQILEEIESSTDVNYFPLISRDILADLPHEIRHDLIMRAHRKIIQASRSRNILTTEEESELNEQLDNIFIELHQADDRIAKDREETLRLGKETRAILTDLRKQLG